MHMVSCCDATMNGVRTLTLVVLVTGQLAQDIASAGRDLEELYGTLDEDSLKLS